MSDLALPLPLTDTDLPLPDSDKIDVLGQVTAPRLSDAGIAYQQGLLADAKWCADFPAQAAMLRQTLAEALSATGQEKPSAPDDRTPAQQLHDRHLGVQKRQLSDFTVELPNGFRAADGTTGAEVIAGTKELLAALQVEPILGKVLAADMLDSKSERDPVVVANALDSAGIKYPDAIANAQFALDQASKNMGKPVTLKPTDLPAYSLAQLHHWGERLRQHAKTRPGSA